MGKVTELIHKMPYETAVDRAKIITSADCSDAVRAEYKAALESHPGRNGNAKVNTKTDRVKAERPSKADRKKALLDDLLAGKITREEHDKAVEAIDRPAGEMAVEIRDGKLCIEIELQEPAISASGKTLVVASSRGNATTTAMVNGKTVIVGLNAYIKP